jgi:DNA (cytosine-5)-methyltransferase 1
MFSGIGGFEYGIQQASSNRTLGDRQQPTEKTNIRQKQDSTNSTSSVGNGRWELPECVGYSEIDKYAIKVYERNFNGHTNYGNATTINAKELPDFELLVGGFPCQAFSIAGKRAGFDDTRGTLFFDIARILKEKQPRNLVLENVKGLLSHNSGRTFTTIIGVLADLGYFVEWQVLNSKDFGVPQNRERVFIVGHLGGEPRRKVFPITGHSQQIASVAGYISEEVWPRRHEQIRRTYNTDGAMPTIPTGQGGGVMTKIAIPVLTPNRVEKRQNGRRFKEAGDPSFTLTGQDIHGVYAYTVDASQTSGVKVEPFVAQNSGDIGNRKLSTSKQAYTLRATPNSDGGQKLFNKQRIRRLTPLECERLQGFPDDWTKYGVGDEPISDTQRYKMCGNAVTTNVVEAVITNLRRVM